MHVRSVPGKSPHFLRKYFSKSLSFGLCVLRGRQVVSVVVLNTCLCVVFLSNVSKGGWGRKKAARRGGARRDKGRGQGGGARRGCILRQKELHYTAKGVPIDGKRSPD